MEYCHICGGATTTIRHGRYVWIIRDGETFCNPCHLSRVAKGKKLNLSPEEKARRREQIVRIAKSPEKRAKSAETRRKKFAENPELGKALSERQKKLHQERPELAEAASKRMLGKKHTEETKRLISQNNKMHTEATRKKNSEAQKRFYANGGQPWNKGKTGVYSKETLEKIGKAGKGRPAWNKGYLTPPEALANWKKARESKPNTYYNNGLEVKVQKALEELHIEFETHKALYGEPDIFMAPNICLFVDGNYWHANPQFYAANARMYAGRLAKEQWEHDAKVTVTLELMGYKVLRLWEHDINTKLDWCIEQIKSKIDPNYAHLSLTLGHPKHYIQRY